VQKLVVPVHLVQVKLQVVHTLLIATSFVFRQLAAQVKLVVKTSPGLQDVHVVVVFAQVKQFESQGSQFDPFSIVLSISQVNSQVFVLKSSFAFELQEVHVVVVPEQVLQFEFQAVHVKAVLS
jgi:hypothetical protein